MSKKWILSAALLCLLAALRGAIAAKPKYHHMDESHASESARDMNEIGG